ncbi:MAG: hypothetical protein ACI9XJ_002546 [Marivirga sp.]|jgi:hypothetical protein
MEKLGFFQNKENFASESQRMQALLKSILKAKTKLLLHWRPIYGKSGYDHLREDLLHQGIQ